MTFSGKFHELKGTAPRLPSVLYEATPAATAPTEDRIHVTLVLRSQKASCEARRKAAEHLALVLPAERKYLDVDTLQREFGPSEEKMQVTADLIHAFAEQHDLQVVHIDGRSAMLEGAISDVEDAFQVSLTSYIIEGTKVLAHPEAVSLPEELSPYVEWVLGLNNLAKIVRDRPVVRMRRLRPARQAPAAAPAADPDEHHFPHTEPQDLHEAYEFPTHPKLSGPVERIGIIALGGGLFEEDLREYFKDHRVKAPKITVVRQPPTDPGIQRQAVAGRWGDPPRWELFEGAIDDPEKAREELPEPVLEGLGWTTEVTMDVQLIGRLCPGVEIVVFIAENNHQGQYWAFSEALYGPLRPPVLSCSWGELEPTKEWSDWVREVEIVDSVLLDATLLGTTICVSSGDRGDGSTKKLLPRPEWPASSPHVLGCGGTEFKDDTLQGTEVVWTETVQKIPKASGGGFSQVFSRPDWQDLGESMKKRFDSQRRGVPDVASKADVKQGFCMMIAGIDIANGGTSAAAPVWASLLAMAANELGARLGNINALLYSKPFVAAARSVDDGSNGEYEAAIGWDPCTGLGSPKWAELCSALKAKKAVGKKPTG